MSKLKYFDFYKSYQLVDLMLHDINNSTRSLLKDDVIVFQKFIELSDKVAMGNYYINNIETTNKISEQYFNLCSAITAYNDCYDYFRQIIYWGLGFYDDFNTSEQYLKLLKDCIESKIDPDENTHKLLRVDSDFIVKVKEYQEYSSEFKTFIKKYNKYQGLVSDKKIGIRQLANCIKHQGGFITQEMYQKHRFSTLYFANDSNTSVFEAKQIYAYIYSTEEILSRLYIQNEKIIEISFWLFKQFFPVRMIAPYTSHMLPKSKILLVNDTEQDK